MIHRFSRHFPARGVCGLVMKGRGEVCPYIPDLELWIGMLRQSDHCDYTCYLSGTVMLSPAAVWASQRVLTRCCLGLTVPPLILILCAKGFTNALPFALLFHQETVRWQHPCSELRLQRNRGG